MNKDLFEEVLDVVLEDDIFVRDYFGVKLLNLVEWVVVCYFDNVFKNVFDEIQEVVEVVVWNKLEFFLVMFKDYLNKYQGEVMFKFKILSEFLDRV